MFLIAKEEKRKDLLIKTLYNNVLAQAISESGLYLFVGTQFADIFVQHIKELLNGEEPRSKLKCYPQESKMMVNCLCFHRNFLIVGSVGFIYALRWYEETRELSCKPDWKVLIPLPINASEVPDVNAMCLCPEVDQLFAGCGDSKVYQISLEDGRIMREFVGHLDYIHDICVNENGLVCSASEDGSVRVWNGRQKQAVAILEPNKRRELRRPEFGKFIGTVNAQNDWLICGGGARMSIWHFKSMDYVRCFDFPARAHVSSFIDDTFIVGGEYPQAQLYDLNGPLKADIPVEHTAAYSIVWQHYPFKFMSIAGYSNKLHILEDFRFLDCKIDLYGNTED